MNMCEGWMCSPAVQAAKCWTGLWRPTLNTIQSIVRSNWLHLSLDVNIVPCREFENRSTGCCLQETPWHLWLMFRKSTRECDSWRGYCQKQGKIWRTLCFPHFPSLVSRWNCNIHANPLHANASACRLVHRQFFTLPKCFFLTVQKWQQMHPRQSKASSRSSPPDRLIARLWYFIVFADKLFSWIARAFLLRGINAWFSLSSQRERKLINPSLASQFLGTPQSSVTATHPCETALPVARTSNCAELQKKKKRQFKVLLFDTWSIVFLTTTRETGVVQFQIGVTPPADCGNHARAFLSLIIWLFLGRQFTIS